MTKRTNIAMLVPHVGDGALRRAAAALAATDCEAMSRGSDEESRHFTSKEQDEIASLYFAAMLAFKFHGFSAGARDPILSTVEFAFMNRFPGLNSYTSFYIPIMRALRYMEENANELLLATRRALYERPAD